MSAGRKSPMGVAPVRAAMMEGSPICIVEEGGAPRKETGSPWWKMVLPWEALRSRDFMGTLSFLQVAMAAWAKSSPRRKFSWLISAAGMGVPSAMWRMAARIGLGMGREAWPRSLDFIFGGAPLMRTRAASMPSAEVPDMRPRARREFLGMGWL